MSDLHKILFLLSVIVSSYHMGRDDYKDNSFIRFVIIFVIFTILCFVKIIVIK